MADANTVGDSRGYIGGKAQVGSSRSQRHQCFDIPGNRG